MESIKNSISNAIIYLIRLYRYLLSPLLGNCCRFYPSCSVYAIEALQQHGARYGSYLLLKRILRCHPWSQGGVDPVPESKKYAN